MKMASIMKILVETKITLLYLQQMHKRMVPQASGQCIIKIKLFLLFLLASHKARSPDLFKGPPRDTSAPPGTPFPFRKHQDEKKAKREELVPPPRPHLRYDEDDEEPTNNKENIPPNDRNVDDWKKPLVQYLLDKWAQDIIYYQEEVLRDLHALKQRLEIP
uniref:E4 protein n=1 Tax=Human papillomavirus TaxID=10566 RepID=A0A386H7I3_9PAPI|nr:MAG: E4 protein [Human papillomavirus]